MALKHVLWKFPGMRKPDDIIVYPLTDATRVQFQGSRCIGVFDPATRKGLVNYKGSNPKYNHHLLPMLGAEAMEFPQEFVDQIMAAIPRSGDEIGPGVTIGEHPIDLSSIA